MRGVDLYGNGQRVCEQRAIRMLSSHTLVHDHFSSALDEHADEPLRQLPTAVMVLNPL
jgi:hypothetical protein